MTLPWGRRYLMCPPKHFGVLYEINPWMSREVQADPERSHEQWTTLVTKLLGAGADVESMAPRKGLPDMVFTANAGVVWGNRFVPSRFTHPERGGEEPHYRRWFDAQGMEIVDLPNHPLFEGAGDALPFRDRFLAGYRSRSEFDSHTALAKVLDVEVLSVELVDPRFYHVDLTFCPLDDRHALIVPEAWDDYGRTVVRELVPEPVVLEPEESLQFSANSVVIGSTIVMPACSVRLGRELERLSFDVCVSPVDEFLKAGGGVRCLTLALDMGPG